jgi:hypothetical protein
MADYKTINYPVTPQPKLALDAQPMSESLSVTIASDQTPIPVSATFSDPSIGLNGATAPTSSGLAGSVDTDTGNLEPINTHDVMGKNLLYVDGSLVTQPISVTTLPLPNNAATETTLNNVDSSIGTLNSKVNNKVYQPEILVNANNDVFGSPVVASKYNQIEIDFNTAPGATFVTNTTTTGGTITQANGQTVYNVNTTTTAQAKTVSVQSLVYRPGNESYAMFTASFTNVVNTGTYQRIGLYDANNGFFVGFEGRFFGITKRTAGVDTFVSQANFNGDKLDGASGSKFTRDGALEAINFGFSNLFRIRFGWLGSASIFYEVMSPDGNWVTFHTIKQPNLATAPSLTNPNLPMTLDLNKNGAASGIALTMTTTCWSAGTTSPYVKITDTLTDNTLATIGRSVITGVTTGGGGGYVNVKVNPSGALVTDSTVSGTVAATQSGTWNINDITGTVSLPTGAATSANQTTANSSLSSIDGKLTSVTVGTLPSIPAGSNNIGSITDITGTVSLPTGAATSANQTTANSSLSSIDGKLPSTLGQKVMSGSLSVAIASDQPAIKTAQTNSKGEFIRNDYSSVNVTTAAYTQLIASTASAYSAVEIFDSSGQTLKLAIGGSGSEIDQFLIFPGGNGRIPFTVPSGSRISIRAVSANATSGEIDINFYV